MKRLSDDELDELFRKHLESYEDSPSDMAAQRIFRGILEQAPVEAAQPAASSAGKRFMLFVAGAAASAAILLLTSDVRWKNQLAHQSASYAVEKRLENKNEGAGVAQGTQEQVAYLPSHKSASKQETIPYRAENQPIAQSSVQAEHKQSQYSSKNSAGKNTLLASANDNNENKKDLAMPAGLPQQNPPQSLSLTREPGVAEHASKAQVTNDLSPETALSFNESKAGREAAARSPQTTAAQKIGSVVADDNAVSAISYAADNQISDKATKDLSPETALSFNESKAGQEATVRSPQTTANQKIGSVADNNTAHIVGSTTDNLQNTDATANFANSGQATAHAEDRHNESRLASKQAEIAASNEQVANNASLSSSNSQPAQVEVDSVASLPQPVEAQLANAGVEAKEEQKLRPRQRPSWHVLGLLQQLPGRNMEQSAVGVQVGRSFPIVSGLQLSAGLGYCQTSIENSFVFEANEIQQTGSYKDVQFVKDAYSPKPTMVVKDVAVFEEVKVNKTASLSQAPAYLSIPVYAEYKRPVFGRLSAGVLAGAQWSQLIDNKKDGQDLSASGSDADLQSFWGVSAGTSFSLRLSRHFQCTAQQLAGYTEQAKTSNVSGWGYSFKLGLTFDM